MAAKSKSAAKNVRSKLKTKAKTKVKSVPKAKAEVKTKAKVKSKTAPKRRPVKAKKVLSGQGLLGFLSRIKILGAVVGVVGFGAAFWHTSKRDVVQESSLPVALIVEKTVAPAEQMKADPAASEPADFAHVRDLAFADRIDYWSGRILEDPAVAHLIAAHGTEPEIADSAPLVPGKFDCTTFVETVMALSQSERPQDFISRLLAIRYKSRNATYFDRNHFPEVDWIPNNEAAGILSDVTIEIAEKAGLQAGFESKRIHRGEWHADLVRKGKVSRSIASASLEVPEAWSKAVDARVPYLPISSLEKSLPYFPNGAIINFVRSGSSRSPVVITHQGLIIRKGDAVFLRHASTGGEIKTVELPGYLYDFQKKEGLRWPLVGVNINMPAAVGKR